MGRTLLGVDLDESRVGGLVRRLLTDEELEKLADGGRPADGDGDEEGDGGTDTDSRGTDPGSGKPDHEPADGPAASVGDRDGTGDGFDGGDWLDDGDDDSGRGLGEYRPLLLKGGAVVLVFVVVGLLVWRYGGRVKAALPFVGGTGGSDGGSDETGDATGGGAGDAGVSPARRRAKAGWRDGDDDSETDDGDDSRDGPRTDDRGTATGASGADVDLGALVGLGTLALVAALVRKFGEKPERDPLVDGPEE